MALAECDRTKPRGNAHHHQKHNWFREAIELVGWQRQSSITLSIESTLCLILTGQPLFIKKSAVFGASSYGPLEVEKRKGAVGAQKYAISSAVWFRPTSDIQKASKPISFFSENKRCFAFYFFGVKDRIQNKGRAEPARKTRTANSRKSSPKTGSRC